jgi:hypothetical protein
MHFEGTCTSFEQACDEALSVMESPSIGGPYAAQFQRANPCGFVRWDGFFLPDLEVLDLRTEFHADLLRDPDIGLRAKPMSMIISAGKDDADVSRAALVAARECPPQQARGRVLAVASTMYRELISTHYSGRTHELFYIERRGRMHCVSKGLGPKGGKEFNEFLELRIAVHAALALTQRYTWQCALGRDGKQSVAFPVERDALPEIFRMRDIPEGKARRAALRHFVTAHFRRKPGEASYEDPTIFVKKHLRGQTEFTWNGLRCEVIPPAYETEKLAG